MLIFIILMAVIGLICLNVPIAISLALAGVLGLLITEGPSSLVTVALDMYDGSTKFSLIAIPMFVLAGAIMNAGGVTRRLIEFVSALIGAVRGGALSRVSPQTVRLGPFFFCRLEHQKYLEYLSLPFWGQLRG